LARGFVLGKRFIDGGVHRSMNRLIFVDLVRRRLDTGDRRQFLQVERVLPGRRLVDHRGLFALRFPLLALLLLALLLAFFLLALLLLALPAFFLLATFEFLLFAFATFLLLALLRLFGALL